MVKKKRSKNYAVTIIAALFIIFVDRISKLWVVNNYKLGESQPIIENVFHITFIYNKGAGFGTFQNSLFFLTLFSAIVLMICLYYFMSTDNNNLNIMLAILMGGVTGNLIDRAIYGQVIDFIDFRIWPIFNVADIAITLSILSLIFYIWVTDARKKKA